MGWIALVGGTLEFLSGLTPIVLPSREDSLLSIPAVYILNVVGTIFGGIVALYSAGLLCHREWGRKGIIVLLYLTAATVAAAPVLLWFADFSELRHLEVVRRMDVSRVLDDVGPEFDAHLKRVTVFMTAVFAAVIVVFHTLLARYLGTPRVRAAFGKPTPPKQEARPLPKEGF